MQRVALTEFRKRLRHYVAVAQNGQEIVITSRGHPVARLTSITTAPTPEEQEHERLLELERRGLIRLGTGELPDAFWTMERVQDPEGRARAALREERDEGW
jgi:prevent-host-death family protein